MRTQKKSQQRSKKIQPGNKNYISNYNSKFEDLIKICQSISNQPFNIEKKDQKLQYRKSIKVQEEFRNDILNSLVCTETIDQLITSRERGAKSSRSFRLQLPQIKENQGEQEEPVGHQSNRKQAKSCLTERLHNTSSNKNFSSIKLIRSSTKQSRSTTRTNKISYITSSNSNSKKKEGRNSSQLKNKFEVSAFGEALEKSCKKGAKQVNAGKNKGKSSSNVLKNKISINIDVQKLVEGNPKNNNSNKMGCFPRKVVSSMNHYNRSCHC